MMLLVMLLVNLFFNFRLSSGQVIFMKTFFLDNITNIQNYFYFPNHTIFFVRKIDEAPKIKPTINSWYLSLQIGSR